MLFQLGGLLRQPGIPITVVVLGALISYVVYQRYLHPLAKYPGPFWASMTNFWKFYHYSTYKLPDTMVKIHEKYGPVVRIGPNDLNFNGARAIAPIYRVGRKMPKGIFYSAFTSFVPNLFGTTDEALHSLRRRQLAHAFSVSALKSMEVIFNEHIGNLVHKVDDHAQSGHVMDLKEAFSYYAYDVTGHLAFNQSFNTQNQSDPDLLPPLWGHFFLGNLYGSVAHLLPWIRDWTSWHPFVKKMIQNRIQLRTQAAVCVERAISNHKEGETVRSLITSLIDAEDPATGAKLSQDEINSEAFGFLVAGSHTTSSSLTVLFYYLTHNPEIYAKMVQEIDEQLVDDKEVYDFVGLETALPYSLAVLRESFRMSPVAALLLPRRVTEPTGSLIDGELIPPGVNCSMVSTSVHHNPDIWGPDHNRFDPDRFYPGTKLYDASFATNLMHFGQGHRQCIGRNIGMISIWKIAITMLKKYRFEAVDRGDVLEMIHTGAADKKGPLLVKITRR
ncbi:uncharacterized protein Z520_00765 [Fonsecaea multimorphosa CBS 102226]|uniref:Cytochrome P450 monooxygenase n=1 Tax=Fonsecaea multimorphosa CBS 102226 TaxID=1442371 RepID=A0A0D2KD68_9EURO|nr:uncharacterized protein Z520_00765 [Fonsecaea multimorphosa CBS 102226]KIY04073.1 hypothetical protein Z520_00765 [Fonsecaea multimorphosa CBS 102226]OAL31908.1 hypothetical protein AYO22_00778 [Fonsecaea multimorphosa]